MMWVACGLFEALLLLRKLVSPWVLWLFSWTSTWLSFLISHCCLFSFCLLFLFSLYIFVWKFVFFCWLFGLSPFGFSFYCPFIWLDLPPRPAGSGDERGEYGYSLWESRLPQGTASALVSFSNTTLRFTCPDSNLCN